MLTLGKVYKISKAFHKVNSFSIGLSIGIIVTGIPMERFP